MNGYNDITIEPADDEAFATAYGYEIISHEELLDMLKSRNARSSQGSFKFPSLNALKKRNGSFPSASSGLSSMMTKPMSSCSLSSQVSDISEEGYSLLRSHDMEASHHAIDIHLDDVDGHPLSVENLWYDIQQKRHLHEIEEEEEMRMRMAHILTMEHSSNGNKLTAWFVNLLHLPEKLKRTAADKHRFNVEKVPKTIRDELKHIYVY